MTAKTGPTRTSTSTGFGTMPRRTRSEIEQAEARSARAHARHIFLTYGITSTEYAQLKGFQGGKCAICQRATGARRRLAVDHSHSSGMVRGLLCRYCNRMLGHARDRPDFFYRAAEYLASPPASQLGLNKVVPGHDRVVFDGRTHNQASEGSG